MTGTSLCRQGDPKPHFLRAVTFGPFPPGVFPGGETRLEFERVRHDLGADAVRFLEPPPRTWLIDCEEIGLLAFITITWNPFTDFLGSAAFRRAIGIRVRDVAARFSEHPSVAGFLMAGALSPELVRYHGPDRLRAFLEHLIDVAGRENPGVLYSHPNRADAPAVLPGNQDFISWDIPCGMAPDEAGQVLFRTGREGFPRPIVISRFGLDSGQIGEEAQADGISRHIRLVRHWGGAGVILSSWSDRDRVEGDAFAKTGTGLKSASGAPKPALAAAARAWAPESEVPGEAGSEGRPRVSVVVIADGDPDRVALCLDALERDDPIGTEVIVVNPGNDGQVRELVSPREEVRHAGIPREDSGRARIFGARIARGDIVVFTRSDCLPCDGWVAHIVAAFDEPGTPDCLGGPVYPFPLPGWCGAALQAAPGALVPEVFADGTVELSDRSLAMRRSFFEEEGADPIGSGGVEVSGVWRSPPEMSSGILPGAAVWRFRPRSVMGFLAEEARIGAEEARLNRVHPGRGTEAVSVPRSPFLHPGFPVLLLVLLAVGFAFPPLWAVAGAGALTVALGALREAFRAEIWPRYDSFLTRLRLAGLIVLQSQVRAGCRVLLSMNPRGLGGYCLSLFGGLAGPWWWLRVASLVLRFQSRENRARESFLASWAALDRRPSSGREAAFSASFPRSLYFRSRLSGVVEPLGEGIHLVRLRIDTVLDPAAFSLAWGLVLAAGVLWPTWWWPAGWLAWVTCDGMVLGARAAHRAAIAAADAGFLPLRRGEEPRRDLIRR